MKNLVAALTEDDKYQIEKIIDRKGVKALLDAIADICRAKADHVLENWQDEKLSAQWNQQAKRIENLQVLVTSEKIEIPEKVINESAKICLEVDDRLDALSDLLVANLGEDTVSGLTPLINKTAALQEDLADIMEMIGEYK